MPTTTTDPATLAVIRKMARELMDENGLSTWTLKFDRATRRAGTCMRGAATISLSGPLMSIWPQEACRMTILHEIAHALTGGGHTREWRRVCLAIGGNGQRQWDGKDGRPSVQSKYTGTCPRGHNHTRARMTSSAKRESCGQCPPRYDHRYRITWKANY